MAFIKTEHCLIPFSCPFKRADIARKSKKQKKLKMNFKILAVALSMVVAQSNNPGVDLDGQAARMQAAYEKMPVERQRRFFVRPTLLTPIYQISMTS